MSEWKLKRPLLSLVSAVALIGVWKLVAALVGLEIIIPSPERVAARFIAFLANAAFWQALGATLVRGLVGFGISCATGLLIGFLIGFNRTAESLLSPVMTVIRSTPILAIILIALIWFSSDFVPIFSCFLMSFPVIASTLAEGVRQTDRRLIEMARLYRVPDGRLIRSLYLPSLFPYFTAAASSALGLCWKVVVAAEVISQPIHAIGTGLQNAKIMLETADVFAWTLAAILLSAITDLVFGRLFKFGGVRVDQA